MALYLVTTLADEAFDGGEAVCGHDGAGLSLREALALANADPDSADAISFDASLKGGTLTLTQGELVIAGNTAIDGDLDEDKCFDITIDAVGASRGIHVTTTQASGYTGLAVNIEGVRITGGYVEGPNTGFEGGAAILVDSPFVDPARLTVTLTNSRLDGNITPGNGALRIDLATAVLDNVDIVDNTGGGISALNADVQVSNSRITGNADEYFAASGDCALAPSEWLNNRATGVGGALSLVTGGYYYAFPAAQLLGSLVAGNTAGGIAIFDGNATLTNVTLTGNAAGTGGGLDTSTFGGAVTEVRNSILAGNTGGDSGGPLTLAGGNIVGGTAFVGTTPVRTGITPAMIFAQGSGVAPGTLLADRGNPALDAGDDALAPAFDLAGTPRPVDVPGVANNGGNAADLGAYELEDLPGDTTIIVYAAGERFQGNPAFSLRVDGELIAANVAVPSLAGPRTLPELRRAATAFEFEVDGPVEEIEIVYANDRKGAGGDRNLFIREVEVDGVTLTPKEHGSFNQAGPKDNPNIVNAALNTGRIYVNGVLTLTPEPPTQEIIINASGRSFQGNPAFDLFVNGVRIADDVSVPSPSQKLTVPQLRAQADAFVFELPASLDIDEIAVVYANDRKGAGGDRNLFIASIEADGSTFRPGSADFDFTGNFTNPSLAVAAENQGLVYVNGRLTLDLPDDTLV